jgi:alkanesulfonate monooxygenase SsuD/methylene tetrahydromethanopterin reductase-like flavin-dependent oxidoreductase (luciferase family)
MEGEPVFLLRFDMRCPDWGAAAPADLYATAVDMARYGEEHGAAAIVVSEHHHSSDGYLPSPLILSSAIATATRTVAIQVGALLLPLHDPVRIAEDMVVLDHLSRGRVSYIMAVGYRPEEYAMFGQSFRGRGKRLESCLGVLREAFTGEPFEFDGRQVWVRPKPFTEGGPMLFMGGRSEIAVRRAARFGMGVLTEGGTGLQDLYLAECEKLGRQPGMFVDTPKGSVSSAFVAEDPDEAWESYGPYLLHDAQMYGAWMGEGHDSVSKSTATDVASLRAENGSYRIFSVDEAIAHVRERGMIALQPLCGGLPPELAWQSLRLVAEKVMPAVRLSGQ